MSDEIDESLDRFGLDAATLNDLRRAGALVVPALDGILDRFYIRVQADPGVARFFDGTARMTSARNAQRAHWALILAGDFGTAYRDSTDRIGRTHARINLPLHVYMSAYAGASSEILTALIQNRRLRRLWTGRRSMARMATAITRAFALDLERVTTITFRVWNEELERAFTHLGTAIDRLAAGDLRHRIPDPADSDFPARYDSVRQRLNGATDRLGSTLGKVGEAVGELVNRSRQVADMSDALSTRTNSQAASLEQTAAAMQAITGSIHETSQTTGRAQNVAHKARDELGGAAQTVQAAAAAMADIKDSSARISSITRMIEDIAFQTNLLALNAGVEAARAGAAGAGFAVVATEVRSLAVNAGEAAKQIRGLIATSATQVDNGVELVERTGSKLEGLVEGFNTVTGLSQDIANAAGSQAHGVTEINTALAQMDAITQKNAAMVDESQRHLADMLARLTDLSALVGQFEVRNPAAPGDARLRPRAA